MVTTTLYRVSPITTFPYLVFIVRYRITPNLSRLGKGKFVQSFYKRNSVGSP
ncbi:hypothetical protein LEQ41_08980 [Streptococcus agalactiae]|nr:hypothetical protein [Streptococcus agalactiae]